ncbi:MAG: class I SAM-dependent methyltransferase, partial [Gemmatimonadota bacterium]
MTTPRMYGEFAPLWPLISDPADYAAEAALWRQALRAALGPGRHHLLELGVGGGNNLSHLTGEFAATAVDRSEQMLANSRRLNPGVEHLVGDMRTLRLGRTFDAVLIHDAISYLVAEEELRQTFATARAHLRPGGVFITPPDHYRETFRAGARAHAPASDGRLELTHVEYNYDPDPADTAVECLSLYILRPVGGRARVE